MGGAPGEGWAVLRALLLGGALSAYRDERTGQTVAIDPSFWAEQVAFEVSETKKLFGGKAAYMIQGEILIDQAQLSTLIHLVRDRLANPQGVPRNTGGGATEIRWGAFLTEAFRIVYESNPMPRNPAELRRRALDSFADAGHGYPSES
jgi:hypothetical protein